MSFKLRAVLLAALSAAILPAQTNQGQISGVIHDKSGAVAPGVQLTVVDVNNGAKYTAATNDSGVYRFPALPPSQYKISAVLQGFKTFSEGPVTIQVNQNFDLDITLEPGQVTETVQVTAEAPPLETANSTLGQVVTTRSIVSLPLNIRDSFALVGLTPGVTFGSNFGNGGGKDVGRNFFKSDFNVGGGRSGSQEILLDGAPNTTPDINRGIINPPVDSVQEFKVQANSYDTEFGRTSGGVINMVTKAGTNDYHGVGYDFERHSNLDANDFFNNRAGRALTSFQRHQFGGDIGGPILKNKWFLFGDYEGLRQGYPNSVISTVPSGLQRQGNFAQTLASNGALITVYDPDTLATLADGSRSRTPFPGNVIPSSRFDQTAAKTVPFYPLANIAGAPVTGQNNYFFAAQTCVHLGGYLPSAAQLIGAAKRVKLESTIHDNRDTATVQEDPSVGLKDQREMSATLVTTAAGSDAAGSEGVSIGSTGNPRTGEPNPVPLPAVPEPATLQYVTVYSNGTKGGFAGSEPVSQPENFRCAYERVPGANGNVEG